MYIPKHFEVTDQEEICRFIKENAFGQLISSVDNRPFSTHLPFQLNAEQNSLFCHVARRNPQWKAIAEQEVLVTFQGAHDYVSPTWYNSAGLPTWNYQAVHVYGKAELITDANELQSLVNALSHTYEQSRAKPWEPDYNPSTLNMIVGIRIHISELQCQFKLSQNRSKEEQQNVIDALNNSGAHALATQMEKHRKQ